MPRLDRLVSVGALTLAAALVSGVAGFVYAHEPARDQVEVTLDRTPREGAPRVVSGVVTRAADGRLVIDGEGGAVDLTFPPSALVEDLQALPPAALTPGMRVNVGAERSDYGVALSGVVAVEQ